MLAAAARWPRCCGLLLGVHVPKEEKVPLPPLPPPPALLQQQQEQEEGQEEQDDIVYTAEPSRCGCWSPACTSMYTLNHH
jgi:hypothetical protein